MVKLQTLQLTIMTRPVHLHSCILMVMPGALFLIVLEAKPGTI